MMRVFLVDDEEPVLNLLERMLESYENIRIAGKFTRPEEAIGAIRSEQIDVVFLDIQMAGMNGLVAAEHLMEAAPDVDVVFVTAYNQYAVEAFELSAVDYILKPPSPNRMNKTVERLLKRYEAKIEKTRMEEPESSQPESREHPDTQKVPLTRKGPGFVCFGRFEWIVDARTGEAVKWRRLKDRELMAYMIHHRNRFVPKETILEDLWPGANPEQATVFLHTCVYSVRKQMNGLGCKERLEFRDNGYRLQMLDMWCDTDGFERMSGDPEVSAGNIDKCEELAKQYEGNYMEKDDFLWAYELEKVLKDNYISLMNRMAKFYGSIGKEEQAMNCLQNAHKRHPFHDEINESILRGYARMGDRRSMMIHYERFTRMMRDELDVDPMESTIQLYRRLCRGSADLSESGR